MSGNDNGRFHCLSDDGPAMVQERMSDAGVAPPGLVGTEMVMGYFMVPNHFIIEDMEGELAILLFDIGHNAVQY